MSDTLPPDLPPADPVPGSSALGPSWQEQDGALREMWMQNKTPQEISEVLGRSISAIMTRAARLGLPRRAAPGRKPSRTLSANGQPLVSETRKAPPRQAVRETPPAAETSPRICLMCLKTFQSLGRHNRICSTCKGSAEYVSASTLSDIHIQTS